jgi:hypothetical protein
MPKFPPPPRIPQKRSAFVVTLAVRNSPSAVMISTDKRLSDASPYDRASQPQPPPRVSPAMPVVEMAPPVVARPKTWVSRSNSPQVRAGFGASRALHRIDAYVLDQRQVNHEAPIADRVTRDVVATAAHRDEQIVGAGELDRRDDVGHSGAADDERRVFVDHRVPDFAGRFVGGSAGHSNAPRTLVLNAAMAVSLSTVSAPCTVVTRRSVMVSRRFT